MIKIGVDCRPLARPLSGIRRYTSELLNRLMQAQEVHWVLYSDRPILVDIPLRPNITTRFGKSQNSLTEMIWYHFKLPALLRKDSIDVFWSPRHHLPLYLPSTLNTVLTIHDMTWKRFPESMRFLQYWSERLQMPYSINRANKIITISDASRSEIIHFYPRTEAKINVIPCGASRFDTLSPLENLPDQYLLFVGTPEPRKNLLRLLEAYSCLPSKIKDNYPLVLAGGHGWKLSLEEMIMRAGLTDHTTVLGAISNENLGYVYSKAKLLLMPSLYEGFGLPILEAFQFGIPALTSNVSSMPEVAGAGGLLVDPHDTASISQAIAKLLTDTTAYKKHAESTTEQLKKFSWEKACSKTMQTLLQKQ